MEELLQKTKDKLVDLVRNGSFHKGKSLALQALKVFDDLILRQYLGICHLGLREYEEARAIFEINIESDGLAEDYNNFGIASRFLKDYEKAYISGKKSLELCQSNPSFYGNLATTAIILGKDQEALNLITQALAISPTTNSFWFDKGSVHFKMNDLKNAEKCYREGLKIKPVNEKYCVELFYCLALQNRFPDAWKFYEFRYNTMPQVNNIVKRSQLNVLLEKKDFYEEKIAISFEQGYGDNLMFLRFIQDFQTIAPNSYLIIEDNVLADYVKKLNIRQQKEIQKDTDKILCIMSLAYHLGIERIPPPKYVLQHKPNKTKKLKIGICWAGSALHPMDYQRSTYLKWYDKFFKDENMEIYAFVKDKRPRIHKEKQELIDFAEDISKYNFTDMGPNLNTVVDSMESLQNIDILICVDTFMAHIAGSMGVPTYLLLSNMPDWRWGIEGNVTTWYPSFKIFRQTADTLKETIQQVYEKIRSEYAAPYFER